MCDSFKRTPMHVAASEGKVEQAATMTELELRIYYNKAYSFGKLKIVLRLTKTFLRPDCISY